VRNVAFAGVQPVMTLNRGRKFVAFLMLLVVLSLALAPLAVQASSSASATSAGFGAAFGYAQTIGPIAYTQAGSIGDAAGAAAAITPYSSAVSAVFSSGPSAAFATSIGSPFGSNAFVQVASFFGGFASGVAASAP